MFVQADLNDMAALEPAMDALRKLVGPFTVLLNNAANDQRHSIDETPPTSWDAGVAVNLKHQFFAARRAAGGGSIINFGSISCKLKAGRHAGLHHVQGRRAGPHTQPGARFRPVQHPRQHPGGGRGWQRADAVCLATQPFPHAPTRRDFPSTLLGPGELFRSTTVHRFRCVPA